MSRIPFAIHGMGRIGRALTRVAHWRPELELVAVNDLTTADSMGHLLARDSVHGRFEAEVRSGEGELFIDGRRLDVFNEKEPARVPWESTAAKIVVESSGEATGRLAAAQHLREGAGPSKVLISAISDDADVMLCRGINEAAYDPQRHQVVSNASCTTNCLAVVLKVLHQEFGVRQALINEVHSYTGNQRLVDSHHSDPRRARAAAINIVPTGTAAPAAVERLIPELQGRLGGLAVRVPTPDVALLDLVVNLDKPVTVEAVNSLFLRQSSGELQGLLATVDEPWVSSDFIGHPASAIIDLQLTQLVGRDLVRVVAWYDNEWGYAHRLADLLTHMGERL